MQIPLGHARDVSPCSFSVLHHHHHQRGKLFSWFFPTITHAASRSERTYCIVAVCLAQFRRLLFPFSSCCFSCLFFFRLDLKCFVKSQGLREAMSLFPLFSLMYCDNLTASVGALKKNEHKHIQLDGFFLSV